MANVKVRYCLAGVSIGAFFFAAVFISGLGRFAGFALKPFIYSVILIPLLEEYLFRGVLQAYFAQKYKRRFGILTFANVLASLIFALCHLFYSDPLHAAAVFLPSLLFGYFYEKSTSLLPCILTHAIFNMNVFVVYRSDILAKIF